MRACRGCGCTEQQACAGGCMWVGADLCSTCLVGAPVLEPEALADPIGLEIPGLALVVVTNVLARAAAGDLAPEAKQLVSDVVEAFDGLLLDNGLLDEAGLAELQAKRAAAAPRVVLASR